MAKLITSVDEIENIDEVISVFVNENDTLRQLALEKLMEYIKTSGCVPNTRTVAGYNLKNDISANDLAGTIASEFTKGGSWYSVLIPWLQSQCGSKKQQDANTDGILALQNKDKWELILDKTLPAQSTDGTLLDFDDMTLDETYSELRIVTALWNSADTGDIQLLVNDMDEPIVTLKNVIQYGATYLFDFTLSNNDVFKDRYIVMSLKKSPTGANATNSVETSYINSSTYETVPDIQSITRLKLYMTAGWNNSTERYVRVYGRK